ncbi:hypothetical protein Tco_0248189, partial [Tanacetum coccineum]
SKVIEIVAAHGIVFALACSGVCAAFSRDTNKRICILNIFQDEVIRRLFYNKNNDSLITVLVYASDNFSSLKCRSTSIEYIQRGQPDAGFPLFESESLKWPGYVEFDDVNGKVLTYSAQDSTDNVGSWTSNSDEILGTVLEPTTDKTSDLDLFAECHENEKICGFFEHYAQCWNKKDMLHYNNDGWFSNLFTSYAGVWHNWFDFAGYERIGHILIMGTVYLKIQYKRLMGDGLFEDSVYVDMLSHYVLSLLGNFLLLFDDVE